MMRPVVAIVGRPNVGKSTLFNALTKSKDALVSSYPGMTRDRQYGDAHCYDRDFILIDTGGFTDETDLLSHLMKEQAEIAISEANKIIFMIDAKAGITPLDLKLANQLRKSGKDLFLVVNKIDGVNETQASFEAHELGLGNPILISSLQRFGIASLVETIFPHPSEKEKASPDEGIRIAIVGQPNAGKSTLINRLLGEERVIVHETPGTTRDSIKNTMTRFEKKYQLIDTAGIRKRKKNADTPEKFSIVKTLQAIKQANVVLYVIDARKQVTEQDLKLLGFVLDAGKALVIAMNKWDGMQEEDREKTKASIDRQLDFLGLIRIHFISALHGSGVGNLFDSINEAYDAATKKLPTPLLTRLLEEAQTTHTPPLVKGRRIKMRYAHAGGANPPRIIIHGNQLNELPGSYKRFLAHFYQKKLKLYGTPIYIELRTSENPYRPKKK